MAWKSLSPHVDYDLILIARRDAQLKHLTRWIIILLHLQPNFERCSYIEDITILDCIIHTYIINNQVYIYPSSLLEGKWALLDKNMETPIKYKPELPLTMLQKGYSPSAPA